MRKVSGAITPARLARAHGLFNVLTGVWPLVDMRSFEKVTGPKADTWLVRTVGGMLVVDGLTQLAAASSPEGLRVARVLGQGTAATLGIIDVVYGGRGRISRVYLLDAVAELAWVVLWSAAGRTRQAAP